MLGEIVWNENTIAVVAVFTVPIAAILGSFWYGIEKTKSDNNLKRSMVDRGMSAEEIERVMAARSPKK